MDANKHDATWRAYPYAKPVLPNALAQAEQQQKQQQCTLQQAWAKVPTLLNQTEKNKLIKDISNQLKQLNAVLVAHYYVEPEVQDLALATGGMVGDSLEMARFGQRHTANTLLIAGVRFMGETAKIVSPSKNIIMPDLDAQCSLDLGCPVDQFTAFCNQYPDHVVVVYANTSAEIKAHADWVVTSSIALEIVTYLHLQGKKIIWGPDRHLGHYIQQQTGADMKIWPGSCLVHNEFQGQELAAMKQKFPDAIVLVHPESPADVVLQADVVGSTSQLLAAAVHGQASTYIVATDQGIVHEMRKKAPDKTFLAAPTAGNGATCKSCAFCPWMAMNSLSACSTALSHLGQHEISLTEPLRLRALKPIERLLHFAAAYREFGVTQGSLPERITQFSSWIQQHHDYNDYFC